MLSYQVVFHCGKEKTFFLIKKVHFKLAVHADYASLRENAICKVRKCLFSSRKNNELELDRALDREREGM